MISVYQVLLYLHIAAGAIALVCGVGASMVKQMNWAHHWHQRFGRSFFYAMLSIFLTALPLSLISQNLFLLLISLFTFYFAYTGWRYAINRSGKPEPQDWWVLKAMLAVCVFMLAYGVFLYVHKSDGNGVTLCIFGCIGVINAWRHYQSFRSGIFNGKQRIAVHATMMLAGSIATVTAFIVTNFSMNPAWVLWLAPTVAITPYIIYWNVKLLK